MADEALSQDWQERLAGIFHAARELVDLANTAVETGGSAEVTSQFFGARRELKAALEQVGPDVPTLPAEFQHVLAELAKIMRSIQVDSFSIPDLFLFTLRSNMRDLAWQGIRALNRLKPENQGLYEWADKVDGMKAKCEPHEGQQTSNDLTPMFELPAIPAPNKPLDREIRRKVLSWLQARFLEQFSKRRGFRQGTNLVRGRNRLASCTGPSSMLRISAGLPSGQYRRGDRASTQLSP